MILIDEKSVYNSYIYIQEWRCIVSKTILATNKLRWLDLQVILFLSFLPSSSIHSHISCNHHIFYVILSSWEEETYFGSLGMLHLPSDPFTPFMVLDEWYVVKKDSMVQLKNKQIKIKIKNVCFNETKKKKQFRFKIKKKSICLIKKRIMQFVLHISPFVFPWCLFRQSHSLVTIHNLPPLFFFPYLFFMV